MGKFLEDLQYVVYTTTFKIAMPILLIFLIIPDVGNYVDEIIGGSALFVLILFYILRPHPNQKNTKQGEKDTNSRLKPEKSEIKSCSFCASTDMQQGICQVCGTSILD